MLPIRLFVQGLCTLLVITVVGTTTLQASQSLVTTRVGDRVIRLPAPAGYADPSDRLPVIGRLARTLTPPSNMSLAFFMSHADISKFGSGNVDMKRYMMVQGYRQTAYRTVSVKDFEAFKKVLISQQDALSKKAVEGANRHMKNVQGDVEKITRTRMNIKIGEMVPLGIFHEDSRSIGMALFTKVRVKGREEPKVIAATTALIRGKLIFLYVYSEYGSQKDLQWVKQRAKSWLRQVKRANR